MTDKDQNSTQKLSKSIEKIQQKKGLPPVHLWHPEIEMDIDMEIKRDGTWLYQGSKIERHKIVKLFSTVLRLDDDGYCLVTPVEKCRIRVEDAPFLITELSVEGTGKEQVLNLKTNCDDVISAGSEHQIKVNYQDGSDVPSPYIHVRSNLNALISRNVFYELVDLAEEQVSDGSKHLGVWSNNQFFSLGEI